MIVGVLNHTAISSCKPHLSTRGPPLAGTQAALLSVIFKQAASLLLLT